MSFVHICLILATGVAAGFLDTVGGGGSLLTMPMLIFLGLPSADANGDMGRPNPPLPRPAVQRHLGLV